MIKKMLLKRMYPYKFLKHLEYFRWISIKQIDAGIYYLNGEYFSIQLIVTSRLSHESNLWLSSLTDDLKGYDIIDIISSEYLKHKRDKLYESAMNIIINANKEQFEEAKPMCEAIRELFKDEFDKIQDEYDTLHGEYNKLQEEYKSSIAIEKKKSKDEGIDIGILSTINSCKSLGATREKTLALIMENFKLNEHDAECQMKKYW